MKKGIIITIAVIVLLLILAVIGYAVARYYLIEKPIRKNTPDVVAEWKIYKDSISGYQIDYAPQATVEDAESGKSATIKYENGSLFICTVGWAACGNEIGVGPDDVKQQISKEIEIDGQNYNLHGFLLNSGEEWLTLNLPNNLKVYYDILSKAGQSQDQFKNVEDRLFEMLSTFKFVK